LNAPATGENDSIAQRGLEVWKTNAHMGLDTIRKLALSRPIS
jgi:hypothetical protein